MLFPITRRFAAQPAAAGSHEPRRPDHSHVLHRLGLPLLTALSLSPMAAWAQAPAAPLDQIVVHASPFGHSADRLVQPIEVLEGEALHRRLRGSIGDLLDGLPGIANASFGAGVGRPVIRGQGGPRLQVLDNGINSMDASAISADHAVALDPLNADQVEVIKGPATLIYGGGASAGIVNVVDDRFAERPQAGLRLRGLFAQGSNASERNAALRVQQGDENWQFGARYALRDAGDFAIPGYGIRLTDAQVDGSEPDFEPGVPWNRLDNSRLRTESYGASVVRYGARGMLGVSLGRFETDYGIPSAGNSHGHDHDHDHGHDHEHGHSHDGVRIDMAQTRLDLRGLLDAPLAGFERLEVRLGVNDYRHLEVEPSGRLGTRFDVQETEARVALTHRPWGAWQGVAGTQLSYRDFEAVGAEAFVPPVLTRGVGLFLVEGREVAGLRVELGARVDSVWHQPSQGQPSTRYTPLALSAGVIKDLDHHLHLRVNAQRAQRAPSAEELYAFGPHLATLSFERGNLDLDVETAHSLDIELSRDHGRWTWSLGAFYNRVDDYVLLEEVDAGLNADGSGTPRADGIADRVTESGRFDSHGELLLVDVTQSDAEFWGFEARAGYRLIDRAGLQLDVDVFGDTLRARRVDDGSDLPRIAPARWGAGAEARYGDWQAGLRYQRVTRQDRHGRLETATPGHDLLAADLGYALPAWRHLRATVYLQGRNLLDEKVRSASSYLKDIAPAPGRSVHAGIRFDLTP